MNTETTVTLHTLCGCSLERKWYGLPPREIKVPIKRAFSWAATEQTTPCEAVRIRVFKLTDAAHPFYRFDEEPEP